MHIVGYQDQLSSGGQLSSNFHRPRIPDIALPYVEVSSAHVLTSNDVEQRYIHALSRRTTVILGLECRVRCLPCPTISLRIELLEEQSLVRGEF